MVFLDLKKTYDRVDKESVRIYGEFKLLDGIKNFYSDSKACMRVIIGKLTAWFGIETGIRQPCVMLPQLLTCLFMMC